MLRARKTLTPRFTDFFTRFEKKDDSFAVYIEVVTHAKLIGLTISNVFKWNVHVNEVVTKLSAGFTC